jgi:hypothetical protein
MDGRGRTARGASPQARPDPHRTWSAGALEATIEGQPVAIGRASGGAGESISLSKAAESDPSVSDALRRWNRFHAVRTLLSCAAFVIVLLFTRDK